jgi:two-component system, NarL family, response regulator DevR
MERTRKIPVLIVDDHQVVRLGLRQIEEMTNTINVVGEAANGSDALREAARLQPEIVLLDYRLPDMAGHEVCRRLKAAHPDLRVIFLISYGVDATTTAAMQSGADGYLLKENDAQKIVDAIHSVTQGGMVIDPALARAAVSQAQPAASGPCGAFADLSEQEQRVLAELATGKADKEIAQALNLQAKTVRNYLTQVYRKLGVHTRTEAALHYERRMRKSNT